MGNIYVTGDMHGEQARFFSKELAPNGMLKEGDILIVCGDFGFIFDNNESELAFIKDLEKLPYTILFCCGNHENFDAIYNYPVVEIYGGKAHKISKNIFHLMRGEVYENVNGKSIFAMGGAYSRDKYRRREGISWWNQELPNNDEYKNASNNLERVNHKVDLIITHTMPGNLIVRMGASPDPHDAQLTGFLEWVMYETEFEHWYCGHWHADMEITDKLTLMYYEVKKVDL